MSPTVAPLIRTTDLSVGFHPGKVLFKNLNLQLYPGKLICFMGPNGIGKSSLIRTLSGLQMPLSGSVSVMESDAGDLTRKLAVVLTAKAAVPGMTVYDLVGFGRYPYLRWDVSLSETDHSVIRGSLEMLGINYLSGMKLTELSDGQLQMATIARALCQQTPIILLDEPTAHLDLNNRLEIMKHLKRFANEMNKAILVSTHELDLALQIADEVWLATAHQGILHGAPEDLVLNGSFDDVFRFKGFDLRTGRVAHPVVRKTPIILEGSGHDLLWTKNALQRCGYEVRISQDNAGAIKGFHVKIGYEESKPHWIITSMKQQLHSGTIAELIEALNSNDCKTHE